MQKIYILNSLVYCSILKVPEIKIFSKRHVEQWERLELSWVRISKGAN